MVKPHHLDWPLLNYPNNTHHYNNIQLYVMIDTIINTSLTKQPTYSWTTIQMTGPRVTTKHTTNNSHLGGSSVPEGQQHLYQRWKLIGRKVSTSFRTLYASHAIRPHPHFSCDSPSRWHLGNSSMPGNYGNCTPHFYYDHMTRPQNEVIWLP